MAGKSSIAILGGTGHEGGGLARRLACAGHTMIIGSRERQKAESAAILLNRALGREAVRGTDNQTAAALADLVILTVPYAVQKSTVAGLGDELKGKILIDATVPLRPPKVSVVQLPHGGSAVAELQEMLGDSVRVVSAFQNVSAHHLASSEQTIDCDVIVCGNDVAACGTVIGLCRDIGVRGFYGGPISNSAAAEALTSILIVLNRRYKISSAGIRLTGIPEVAPAKE